MLTININKSSDTFYEEISAETTLAELIQRAGVLLDLRCSSKGTCGRCTVRLIEGTFETAGKRHELNNSDTPIAVLSCQTRVLSDTATVHVPKNSMIHADGQIAIDYTFAHDCADPVVKIETVTLEDPQLETSDSELKTLQEVLTERGYKHVGISLTHCADLALALKSSRTVNVALARTPCGWNVLHITSKPIQPLAVAIDIGTTTIATALLDLEKCEPLASASAYNRQAALGDNVASRISAVGEDINNLSKLQDMIIKETINPLISELCRESGQSSDDIYLVCFSGNTVMTHLALNLSPESIGALPFQPAVNEYPDTTAAELNLSTNSAALVRAVPSISGYIGGDITSGIRIAGLANSSKRELLIDIGTNCEIILADQGQLYSCAAAAGPAFEGAGISCGSRAAPGAIDTIAFNEKLDIAFTTIDDIAPAGICGSAIIDFIAAGFTSGLINSFGRFDLDMLKKAERYLELDYGYGLRVNACIIATNGADGHIVISESDVEQVLKAKAAVYSGLKTLMNERNLGFGDLDRIHLAGGFAKYLNLENAITMGMLPAIPTQQFHKIGNSSLAGAVLSCFDTTADGQFRAIRRMPKNVALNLVPGFESCYIDALMIPNFDPDEFPST